MQWQTRKKGGKCLHLVNIIVGISFGFEERQCFFHHGSYKEIMNFIGKLRIRGDTVMYLV